MLHHRFDPDPFITADPVRQRAASVGQSLASALRAQGTLTAQDLARLQSLANRHRQPLTAVIRGSGMADDAAILRAQAAVFGATVIDPLRDAPDPRLVDALGVPECLRLHCLPWRRAGGVTVIACADPDQFGLHRAALQATFGPVAMALTTPPALKAALAQVRGQAMRTMAETCVPIGESCRAWNARRFSAVTLGTLTLLASGFAAAPGPMFFVLFGVVMLALLAGTGLKLAAALAQATRPARQPSTVRPFTLPLVSILVPLFHEPDIAPRLVARLGCLRYPRARLEILLVVEADDHLTRDALSRAELPPWMTVIPVPPSPLRTKPKALNYAMNFARGSIVGVYDAEDAPSPDQIDRVVNRFAAAGLDLACIQGMLDYYNPTTNWLSRCFTIEYAAWFRIVLPGMERLGLAVPLGGTTLFFRRAILDELGGWDAHNVTEDADLGIRLARHGYRTELLDSVTAEEANCRLWPWIKQRSRWLKGYALTYAVHMRAPRLLLRQLGLKRFVGFQILFLGTLVQFLLAPVLWSFWLVLFGIGHPVADMAPSGVMLATTLAFALSETVSVAVNIAAVARGPHRALWPWVFSLQAYFPLAVIAAYKGLFEMLRAPFFWDKTAHGLHDTPPEDVADDHFARRRSPDSSLSRVSNAREICVRSA
ncbi:MAG: glycosyltransferase [Paracoccaceae bacterium]